MTSKEWSYEDRKHYERRLTARFWDIVEGKDPAHNWDLFEENSVENMIRHIARNWDEARVLVETLENTHLDDEYTPEKQYPVAHFMDGLSRNLAPRQGKDPNTILRSKKNRAEILKRLTEIANDDFGDDPDAWRAWYKAFDDDPLFPPHR